MKRYRNELQKPVETVPEWRVDVPHKLSASEALSLWQQVSLHMVRDDAPDLSIRQMSILLTIYLEIPPHTVRGLALKLGVSKPVITRALDTMGRHSLVTRRRDDNDRRNVLIQRTVEGSLYLEHLADTVIEVAQNAE